MNRRLEKLRGHDRALAARIENQGDFLTERDIAQIAHYERLMLILVRCGNGRFLTPAQDVSHFVKIITEHGLDYVRDISLPVD